MRMLRLLWEPIALDIIIVMLRTLSDETKVRLRDGIVASARHRESGDFALASGVSSRREDTFTVGVD